ncbi:MAG TPA: hypothetical protein VIU63_08690 [Nitrospira sp.]
MHRSGEQVHHVSHDEWLGAETNVPNLSQELRNRDRRSWEPALPWIAGALFVSGLLLGGAASWVLTQSRRSD